MVDRKALKQALALEGMAARVQEAIDQERAEDGHAGHWTPVSFGSQQLARITGLTSATARKYAAALVESGKFALCGTRWTTQAERRRFQIADRARDNANLLREGGETRDGLTRDGLVAEALKLAEAVNHTLDTVCRTIERPACEVDAVAVDRLRDLLGATRVRLLEGAASALLGTASGIADPDAHRKLRDQGRALATLAAELDKAL